jgi:hypothetical protein
VHHIKSILRFDFLASLDDELVAAADFLDVSEGEGGTASATLSALSPSSSSRRVIELFGRGSSLLTTEALNMVDRFCSDLLQQECSRKNKMCRPEFGQNAVTLRFDTPKTSNDIIAFPVKHLAVVGILNIV